MFIFSINSSVVTSAIEALIGIAKNSKIAGRGTVCSIIIGVFMRLSCFDSGNINEMNKKIKKKQKTDQQDDQQPNIQHIIDCVKIVEEGINLEGYPRGAISNIAAVKLLSLLSDIGMDSIEYLNLKSDGKEVLKINNDFDNSFLNFVLSFLKTLLDSDLNIIYKDDQHDTNQSMKKELLDIIKAINGFAYTSTSQITEKKIDAGIGRLVCSLKELISHSLIHTLATEGFDIEVSIYIYFFVIYFYSISSEGDN